MLVSHQREKLINTIIYFVKNTSQCGKTKLFKLLFFLDFEHFKQTGRSVTELEYNAYPLGPLPESLNSEIEFPPPDLEQHVKFKPIITSNDRVMYRAEPLSEFDPSHFTAREIRIMEQLADEFREHSADQMVEATHLEGSPWHQVYEVENAPRQPIPYEYVFADHKIPEDLREKIMERSDMARNYM